MSFPRLAIHTGSDVVPTNKHPEWQGTIVIQHNETTTTILKFGDKVSAKARKRHPLLSTFQSNCRAGYWVPFNGDSYEECLSNDVWTSLLFGQVVKAGKIEEPEPPAVGVQPPVEH